MKFFVRNFWLLLIFNVLATYVAAQNFASKSPRLVIGIMIDGLQQRHIDQLWNRFDNYGFKQIVEKGAICNNIYYNLLSAGNASDIATVMTGTTPYYHGVTGNHYFSRKNKEIQSIIYDENELGIGTKLTVSAHHLLSSTVTDELMLNFPHQSKTYAVAINPEEALMLAGHTANSTVWISDETMKWITTTYYSDGLAASADEMNVNDQIRKYASMIWEPMYSPNTYLYPPQGENKKTSFQYKPDSKRKNSSLLLLKNTPTANAVVADLAYRIVNQEKLGTDDYPDFLLLQFTVKTPYEKTSVINSAEKEDIYLQLDKDIQYLLQKIDSKIGMSQVLVFMFGNQTNFHTPIELGNNKIPAGYFNGDRSMALLNTYLMAIYGQEKWVEGYYGKNIFLNRRKIEEKKLNLYDIQQTVADFMLEFEGVQAAFTATQVLNANSQINDQIIPIRNSFHKNTSGDVILTLLPGWIELNENNQPVGESNAVISYTPVYFYGWNIKPQKINTFYPVTSIAPTLSKILSIPEPNACVGTPIKELIQEMR